MSGVGKHAPPLAHIGKFHKFGRFWVKQEQLRSNNLFLFTQTSSGTLKRSRIFFWSGY